MFHALYDWRRAPERLQGAVLQERARRGSARSMMTPRVQKKRPRALPRLLSCFLVLCWHIDQPPLLIAAAQSMLGTGRGGATVLDSAEPQFFFEDLPEGFHNDVDSITVAVGGHHTCALEYRPGVDFGGPVRCWGRNDWGQSAPSDAIFVQV